MPIFRSFVDELQGRFEEFCSNEMLIAIFKNNCYMGDYTDKILGDCEAVRENAAYSLACPIFESMLEHGCGASCNGHHIAQDFCRFLEDRIQ